ncbi:MAG: quinate 5-dehydrogenase [Actinomycetota bacterium]
MTDKQKDVVSVSLGSSSRDHEVEVDLLGQKFKIKRVGTDGDIKKAKKMIKELDGSVDAFGLGGIDLYLFAPGGKRYKIREAKKFKKLAKKSDMVDGSGLKNTLERKTIEYMKDEEDFQFVDKKVLMVSAVDRFGMAEALHEAGAKMVFGDLIFGLKIPVAIRSMRQFEILARILLPVATKLPFKVLYPTGSEQDKKPRDKYGKYYREADIIAGDYLFIKKYMPQDMEGKVIITNTVTPADVEELKKRGVALLITTTPEFEGRSFGTNVMEATCVALLGKNADDITPEDYLEVLQKLGFKPRVERLAETED